MFLLSGGGLPPVMRVIMLLTFKGIDTVLMDGVITNHQAAPQGQNGKFLLTITGTDLTALMDLVDFSGAKFPALPPSGRVLMILKKYALIGIIPKVIPSVLLNVPIPTERIPSQKGTDLSYIKTLAREVGYVFYLEPGLPGTNTAYWGPQIKIGIPQPALSLDMGSHTNVNSLSFKFDSDKGGIPIVYSYDDVTKIMTYVAIPPVTPLNPPLGMLPPISSKLNPVSDDLSKYSVPKAIMLGMAKAAQLEEAVTADGELNVLKYGHILRCRKLVGVRGAGMAFNGLYYVKEVTHRIKKGEYKQSFKLSRNGLISTIPKVKV
jgi:hypothetical protein